MSCCTEVCEEWEVVGELVEALLELEDAEKLEQLHHPEEAHHLEQRANVCIRHL